MRIKRSFTSVLFLLFTLLCVPQLSLATDAPNTTASPAAGIYAATQYVTLSASSTATIYYTTDGSNPTTSSTIYSTPFPISSTSTLKYFARDAQGNQEPVKTLYYTIGTTSDTGSIIQSAAGTYTHTFTNDATVTVTYLKGAGGGGCDWYGDVWYDTGAGAPTFLSYDGVTKATANGGAGGLDSDGANGTAANSVGAINVTGGGNPGGNGVPVNGQGGSGGSGGAVMSFTFTASAGKAMSITLGSGGWSSGPYAGYGADGSIFVSWGPTAVVPSDVMPDTTVSPMGGAYASTQYLTLSANKPATIYYTTNGTTPTTSSTIYSNPFPIASTSILKYFARDAQGNQEPVKTLYYTIGGTSDTGYLIQSAAGTYTHSFTDNATVTVTYLKGAGGGGCDWYGDVWYDTGTGAPSFLVYDGITKATAYGGAGGLDSDGANGTASNSFGATNVTGGGNPGGNGVPVNGQGGNGGSGGEVMSFTFNVTAGKVMSITLGAGGYPSGPVAGYGADGSIFVSWGSTDFVAPTVTPAPVGGSYNGPLSVTLTASESATIYYTTDGSTPTTNSPVYRTPLSITSTTTVKYFAKDPAGNSGAVGSQTYVILPSTDTGSIVTGTPGTYTHTFSTAVTVRLTYLKGAGGGGCDWYGDVWYDTGSGEPSFAMLNGVMKAIANGGAGALADDGANGTASNTIGGTNTTGGGNPGGAGLPVNEQGGSGGFGGSVTNASFTAAAGTTLTVTLGNGGYPSGGAQYGPPGSVSISWGP